MYNRGSSSSRDVAGSSAALASVALGMGASLFAGMAVLAGNGGLLAATGAYILAGSGTVAGVGVIQAARPLRPRLRRLAARLARPAAILTH
jgi:hypothetical protein